MHHRIACTVAEQPGCLTRDYVRMLRVDMPTVSRLMQRLRAHGYVRPERVAGARHGTVTWWPTPELRRKLDAKQQVTLPRGDPACNDDDWTPQPWVHPIRARALRARENISHR